MTPTYMRNQKVPSATGGSRDESVAGRPGWSCTAQRDTDIARQLPMVGGQCLGLATREESRVEPTVVAHAHRAASQVDDLDGVRVTLIGTRTVVVVASVRGGHRACRHLGDAAHRFSHGDPSTSLPPVPPGGMQRERPVPPLQPGTWLKSSDFA